MSVVRSRGRLNPRPLLLSLALCLAGAATLPLVTGAPALAAPTAPGAPSREPVQVDPSLRARLDGGASANMLVYFKPHADLSAAFGMDWTARGRYVRQQLEAVAQQSQGELRAYLAQQGVQHQAFWIDNVVHVRNGNRALLDALTSRPELGDISAVIAEPDVHLIEPEPGEEVNQPQLSAAISNIEHVRAPQVWELGLTGRGIVVANIDTGVRHTHSALVRQYRGTLAAGQYDHNYNWWSPYTQATAPSDSHNHGSHVIGTMVGDDGLDHRIGMAPGAHWMACQGFNPSATSSALLECGQFMLAPWDLNHQNADADRRPHVVNNSWGDCDRQVNNWYEGVVDAWIAAGIVPIFSNGNAGNCSYTRPPGLNTVGNPARYGKVFSIGSTGTDNGLYASHSNWGPTDYASAGLPLYPDHQGFANIKPNVVAPGVNILSAGRSGDDYFYSSTGTSMSAPHVAGLIALMWEAAPCLVGDYATTGTLIMRSARPLPYASGGSPAPGPGNVPNYATGWGEIDALAAVDAALEHCGSYTLSSEQSSLRVCAAAPASYTLRLHGFGGFTDAVTLSVDSGLPAGVTASFSQNPSVPADPAATTVLDLGNTAGQASASHTLVLAAQSSGPTFAATRRRLDLALQIDGGPLAAPALTAPTAGEVDVPIRPNFVWAGNAGESYRLQVATDAAFTAPVIDQAVTSTALRPTTTLATGTTYHWRVRGENTCGGGDWAASGQFTTRIAPVADIQPGSLTFNLAAGASQSATLTVTNAGTSELTWAVDEAGTGNTHLRQAGSKAEAAWQNIGPAGGDVNAIAISPMNPDVLLAGTVPPTGNGTVYRSTDGGATWSKVIAGNGAYHIVFTPDGTAYAGTQLGMRKSTDNGATWSTLNLGIGSAQATYSVAYAPSNPAIVWAGITNNNGQQTVNLVRSTNAGTSWQNVTPPLSAPLIGQGIAVHPTNPNIAVALFSGAFGGGQVWITSDGGASWTNRSAGLPGNPLRAVHIGADNRILVGGGQAYNNQFVGLYASQDLGASWTALHTTTPPPHVEAIAVDPQNPASIFLATSGSGIHHSSDGGASWQTGIGGAAAIATMDLALQPGDSSRVVASALSHAVLRSTDGGASFAKYGSGIAELWQFDVAANPQNPQQLAVAFQSQNSGGVYTSQDGGQSWELELLPSVRYNRAVFAPDGTLYANSTGPTNSAEEALYRKNGDGSWTHIGPNQGAAGYFLIDLSAVVFSHNDPDLIIAAGRDNGLAGTEATIWRTTDRGQNWTKVYEATSNAKVTAVEIVQDGTDLNVLASWGGTGFGGMLHSADGGATWTASSSGLPTDVSFTNARLCSHAATPQRIFLAIGSPTRSYLYRSSDGGGSWQATGWSTTTDVMSLACDPLDSDVLYAAQNYGSVPRVMRSGDGGLTFAPFDTGIPVSALQPKTLAFKGDSHLLLSTYQGTFETSLGGEARACINPLDIPWLGVTPTSGSNAPGSSTSLTVSADASGLALGQYRAQLCFNTNDPNAELVRVPVQLNVADAASGTLAGDVSALGYCGRQTTAAANAQVTITGQHNSFTLATDANGRFSLPIALSESPLSVLVHKTGHLDATQSNVTLTSAQTTELDLQLALEAACVDLAPAALDLQIDAGQTATHTLTIRNSDGAGTLNWSAGEAVPTTLPAAAPAAATGPATRDDLGRREQILPHIAALDLAGATLNCTAGAGLIRHDDGNAESGYSGDPDQMQHFTMVDHFVPTAYPAAIDGVCLALLSLGPSSLDFDIVVHADDGPGGAPGTLLGVLPATANNLPIYPPWPTTLPWYGFDLSSLNLRIRSGGVYIGLRWAASNPGVFITADTSTGQPANVGQGYSRRDAGAWTALATSYSSYRSLMIRGIVRDLSGCDSPSDVSWLTLNATGGSVAPGASTDVGVQVDSSGLAAGAHYGSLCLSSNDPQRPRLVVPVKLTVMPGAGAVLSVLGGSGQNTPAGTAFPLPLAVQLRNGNGQPLPGVAVDFAAPAGGASAVLSQARVVTDANGYAAVQAVANASAGSYAVSATVGSLPSTSFALTNLAASTDLAVEVRSLRTQAKRGELLDYLVTVRNLGRDAASGAGVSGQLSAQLDAAFAGWQCLGPASSQCTNSGSGNLEDADLSLPAGGSLSYLVTAPVRWDADGIAELHGRSTHAADANPINDEQTAGVPIVLFRDGFEPASQTAGLTAGAQTLSTESAAVFLPGAATTARVDTVLAAFPGESAGDPALAAFRIERVGGSEAQWLRLVARDADGQAYSSAWMRAAPAQELLLELVDLQPADGHARQRLLRLHGTDGVVAVPLTDPAAQYLLRSSMPLRSVSLPH
jgi:hypothetical protein